MYYTQSSVDVVVDLPVQHNLSERIISAFWSYCYKADFQLVSKYMDNWCMVFSYKHKAYYIFYPIFQYTAEPQGKQKVPWDQSQIEH